MQFCKKAVLTSIFLFGTALSANTRPGHDTAVVLSPNAEIAAQYTVATDTAPEPAAGSSAAPLMRRQDEASGRKEATSLAVEATAPAKEAASLAAAAPAVVDAPQKATSLVADAGTAAGAATEAAAAADAVTVATKESDDPEDGDDDDDEEDLQITSGNAADAAPAEPAAASPGADGAASMVATQEQEMGGFWPFSRKKKDPRVNCVWGEWGLWSECSKSCGAGLQERVRYPLVTPRNGGTDCAGDRKDVRICNNKKCPENTTTAEPSLKEKVKAVAVKSKSKNGSVSTLGSASGLLVALAALVGLFSC